MGFADAIKDWNRLYIMHKDRRVATLYKNGRCVIYYPSFMPYNLYLEKDDDLDTRLSNLSNFYYWCSSRLLTLDRRYAKEILNAIGALQAVTDKDRAMIAISYHCLTLTDVFWVKMDREALAFSQISLYRHSLSNAFAEVSLRGSPTVQNAELIGERDVAGDIGTQGVAPKAWIRREDGFYLYKDGDIRDVEAELLASKIVDCFRVDHVSYTKDTFSGLTVAKCKIVTSEEYSIVPFEFVSVYCENHDQKPLDFVLKRDSYNFYMMNLIDYLIGNIDRHWGNWGFLADNRNNRLVSLFPLMDYNKSFRSYDTPEGDKCLPLRDGSSQKEAALQAVRAVGLNMIAEVQPSWFEDEKRLRMFFTRLFLLQDAAGMAHPSLDEIMARRSTATHSSGTGDVTYQTIGGDLTISFDYQAQLDTEPRS